MHRNPARDWTIESLAREVGLSRSALAERFTQFVGRPPMQYLANWRMQLAANQLLSGTESIASIASQVGYESEAAFSRAFKKMVGAPPEPVARSPQLIIKPPAEEKGAHERSSRVARSHRAREPR